VASLQVPRPAVPIQITRNVLVVGDPAAELSIAGRGFTGAPGHVSSGSNRNES
jgi:hypothetical protein